MSAFSTCWAGVAISFDDVKVARALNHDDLQAWSLSWSPDGTHIAVTARKAHRGD
jgi:hypothetical protein